MHQPNEGLPLEILDAYQALARQPQKPTADKAIKDIRRATRKIIFR
jgi:hypothetical protein